MSLSLIEIWSACIFIDFKDIKLDIHYSPIIHSILNRTHRTPPHNIKTSCICFSSVSMNDWDEDIWALPCRVGGKGREENCRNYYISCLLYSVSYTQCNRVLIYRLRAFIQLEYHRTVKRVGRVLFSLKWNDYDGVKLFTFYLYSSWSLEFIYTSYIFLIFYFYFIYFPHLQSALNGWVVWWGKMLCKSARTLNFLIKCEKLVGSVENGVSSPNKREKCFPLRAPSKASHNPILYSTVFMWNNEWKGASSRLGNS